MSKSSTTMAGRISSFKQYASRLLDARFIFLNSFVPLLVLTAYLILFAALFPDGVNRVFAAKSWKYILALAALAGLVSLALLRRHKQKKRTITKQVEKITRSDLILLLLPLMPVAQYSISNREILSPAQMIYLLGVFLTFSLLLVVLIPKWLGHIASTRTLMLLGTAFAFTITNMASLSYQHSWFEQGSLRFQWAIFGSVFLISWFFYDFGYKNLIHLLITVLFVSNGAVQAFIPITHNPDFPLADYTPTGGIESANKLVQLIGDRTPTSSPSIYLLVYDAYAHNETMLSYGIDNNVQEDYLASKGFTLYPHAYSVGGLSLPTMSRVLNASTDYYGVSRTGVSGDGVVQHLLKSFGYQTYGIFPSSFFFRGIQPRYDVFFPKTAGAMVWLVSKAIITGEFRGDMDLEKLPTDEYLTAKREVLRGGGRAASPLFLYTHSEFPGHSPIANQCLPDPIERFEVRLLQANIEMRQDIELLLENDPGAIIIIAGDHGPYLTKNCDATNKAGYDISQITRQDIQDRFGTFLAIRWPSHDYQVFDDITVLQDVFPAIFAYIFNDASLLEAKIEPSILQPEKISGASVRNGIIYGGVDDGEPLFVGRGD